jgi:hypothetical protein
MTLSETAQGLLRGFAEEAGISQSAYLELLLRTQWARMVAPVLHPDPPPLAEKGTNA